MEWLIHGTLIGIALLLLVKSRVRGKQRRRKSLADLRGNPDVVTDVELPERRPLGEQDKLDAHVASWQGTGVVLRVAQ